MNNVLIFEPHSIGHRMVYVRYLLRAMERRGGLRAILVTSLESQSDPYVIAMTTEFGELLSIVTIEFPILASGLLRFIHARLAKQAATFRVLRSVVERLLSQTSVDYVFVPFLDDYCLFPMALKRWPFRRLPWGGIAIRPRFHLHNMGAKVPTRWEDLIEKFAYHRLLRNRGLDRLFSIDPYLEPYFRDDKIASVPDPSDIFSVAPTHMQFGLPSDAVVLLVYGYLDVRKAIDRLMRAMLDARVDTRLMLLLAGLQCPELSAFLTSDVAQVLRAQRRLVEINRHISDVEEAAAFRRANIVWSYYPHNYCSSGALVRAGQSSRPVIATREGLVGLIVGELGMGVTVAEDDDEGLVMALVRLGNDAMLRAELGKAGFKHFSKATAEAFGDRIVAQIAHVLGQ